MEKQIARTPIGFKSHDGKTQIKGCVWALATKDRKPGVNPRAIVQLVHGMSEHIERYDDFACYLARKGYVVCGEDHVGHGKSAASPDDLGCLPVKGGKDVLIEDVHELRKTVAARFSRQTPYVMFGHSMGSFIVRAYVARYGEGLAGAVVCGTGNQSRMLSKAGNFLARRIAAAKGENARSELLHNMGAGAFSKGVDNPRTPLDWLSTDDAVVDSYLADPLCGAMFSVGGYATLTDLTGEVVTPASASAIPKNLPLFYIAGDQDPVGEKGKAVREAANLAYRAGVKNVRLKLYEGMRHEILNEPGKADVYEDVLNWLEQEVVEA
ncbi:MAG: lysophospholipase [Eggerthellaceae bacterium]|nr:lysophospholipase [Eggerthellaceae bacterium]